jgi:hypothetical protein
VINACNQQESPRVECCVTIQDYFPTNARYDIKMGVKIALVLEEIMLGNGFAAIYAMVLNNGMVYFFLV